MYTLAYVTYQDIQNIQAFQEQIVIAIRAPEETRLEIPVPKEVSFYISPQGTKVLKFDFLQQQLVIDFQFLCHADPGSSLLCSSKRCCKDNNLRNLLAVFFFLLELLSHKCI